MNAYIHVLTYPSLALFRVTSAPLFDSAIAIAAIAHAFHTRSPDNKRARKKPANVRSTLMAVPEKGSGTPSILQYTTLGTSHIHRLKNSQNESRENRSF